MRLPHAPSLPLVTLLTLLIGAVGAGIAWLVSAPVFILLGPAVAVSAAGLAGLRTGIDNRLRDVCFVVLGVAVGAGFDEDALGAMLRWPLAFAFMALTIWAMMVACRAALERFFGMERRAALLAASPGHLSFVLAMAEATGSDAARVSIVQSVRLLALTIVVPFVTMAMGIDLTGAIAPQGAVIGPVRLVMLFVVAVVVGLVFQRLRLPAPLLLGAMVVSAVGHLTGLSPGVLPVWMVGPAYLVLGALIGTRFSRLGFAAFRSGLAAGLVVTLIAVVLAALASVPVAWALGMPLAHVLIGFAPGGLETMIAIGVVLAVTPGFVAACHIARLLVLTVLLPAMLGRERG